MRIHSDKDYRLIQGSPANGHVGAMTTISELEKRIGGYLTAEEVEKVRRAYEFSASAMKGSTVKAVNPTSATP